jgi:hypothetical protein
VVPSCRGPCSRVAASVLCTARVGTSPPLCPIIRGNAVHRVMGLGLLQVCPTARLGACRESAQRHDCGCCKLCRVVLASYYIQSQQLLLILQYQCPCLAHSPCTHPLALVAQKLCSTVVGVCGGLGVALRRLTSAYVPPRGQAGSLRPLVS